MDMLFLDNLNIPMESVMSVAAEHSGVSTLIGTPKEVQARLGRSHADRVLVLTFNQIKPTAYDAKPENYTNVAASMFEVLLQRQDRESLERLAEVLVPRTPPSPRLLKEAAMLVQTRKAVLESGDWLTAAEGAVQGHRSLRRTQGWLGYGLLVPLRQQLPGRQAPAGSAGDCARAGDRGRAG